MFYHYYGNVCVLAERLTPTALRLLSAAGDCLFAGRNSSIYPPWAISFPLAQWVLLYRHTIQTSPIQLDLCHFSGMEPSALLAWKPHILSPALLLTSRRRSDWRVSHVDRNKADFRSLRPDEGPQTLSRTLTCSCHCNVTIRTLL